MRVAVVTPYYKEPHDILLRCVRSVRKQTYEHVKHFMVADGYPQHLKKVEHIRIPPSADCGNTPRGVGVLVALAQGFDAIALLDADCWMDKTHIENMVRVMQETGAPIVTSPRKLWNPDTGKCFATDLESDGNNWNDTNCFLIRSDAAHLFAGWMFGKKQDIYMQDRIFWDRVKNSGLKIARMPEPTVNYWTTFASHYLTHNEPVCEKAKVIVQEGDTWVLKPYTEFQTIDVELNTLAWPNADPRLVRAHLHVCKHLGLDVAYTMEEVPHGLWMDKTLASSASDIVGFLDVDCVPLNRQAIDAAVQYVAQTKSFIGLAQVSNHIPPCSHIFAAPAFFFIWRETWEKLGRPTFLETPQADVAENVSYSAEVQGLRYKTLFPVAYTKPAREGIWNLHTYGVYGIGTLFEGGVYHLYQGRFPDNVELFEKVCESICNNTFSTQGMTPCR